jgi:hypothetical protein
MCWEYLHALDTITLQVEVESRHDTSSMSLLMYEGTERGREGEGEPAPTWAWRRGRRLKEG